MSAETKVDGYISYTPEIIRKLYLDGLTCKTISKRYQISESSVRLILIKLGVSMRNRGTREEPEGLFSEIEGVCHKKCTKCKQYKPVDSQFYKKSTGHRGYMSSCRSCHSKTTIQYIERNAEATAKRHKKWKQSNPERYKQYRIKYRSKHAAWAREKYKKDPAFRIIMSLRSRLGNIIRSKNIKKCNHMIDLLGCSPKELCQHLESLFQPGMTWGNYGRKGWHIDHIRPCASFDLTDPEQQKQCSHYTNLQPLWAIDNIRKGDKI